MGITSLWILSATPKQTFLCPKSSRLFLPRRLLCGESRLSSGTVSVGRCREHPSAAAALPQRTLPDGWGILNRALTWSFSDQYRLCGRSGCYDRTAQSGADRQHTPISHSPGGWKSKTKVPADSVPGEDPLPGSQMTSSRGVLP